jgi:hypothetical protein
VDVGAVITLVTRSLLIELARQHLVRPLAAVLVLLALSSVYVVFLARPLGAVTGLLVELCLLLHLVRSRIRLLWRQWELQSKWHGSGWRWWHTCHKGWHPRWHPGRHPRRHPRRHDATAGKSSEDGSVILTHRRSLLSRKRYRVWRGRGLRRS